MKNYKVTNRGKIFLTVYTITLIGSYFFSPIVFYILGGVLIVLLGVEMINYLLGAKNSDVSKEKEAPMGTNVVMEEKPEDLINATNIIDESQKELKKENSLEKVDEKNLSIESFESNSSEDYENIVDDFESIDEDIQSMEKDLEAISKKATTLQINSIENYYQEKKNTITSSIVEKEDDLENQMPSSFEEESLLDTILDNIKTFFSFKKYKKGNLVLHQHFGIGKIIDAEETLKVSFINDHLEEIIEFEYDKKNKIPELDLFKAPKGEDERQYYYNYKRDISKDLLSTMEKIDLNLPDIKYQWNVFLKSGSKFERYDFIAISDRVHVFSKENKNKIQLDLLEKLLRDYDLDIKTHEISDYTFINSILLKSKIKGIVPFEVMDAVNQLIAESNIKDFNERMQYLEKSDEYKN